MNHSYFPTPRKIFFRVFPKCCQAYIRKRYCRKWITFNKTWKYITRKNTVEKIQHKNILYINSTPRPGSLNKWIILVITARVPVVGALEELCFYQFYGRGDRFESVTEQKKCSFEINTNITTKDCWQNSKSYMCTYPIQQHKHKHKVSLPKFAFLHVYIPYTTPQT